MNKKIPLIICFLSYFASCLALFGQEPYTTDYEVIYDVTAQPFKNIKGIERNKFRLLIGNNASAFLPYHAQKVRHLTDSIKATGGDYFEILNEQIRRKISVGSPSYDIYKLFVDSPKLVWIQQIFDKHKVTEEIPDIAWNVVSGDSIICGQKCKKATGTLNGVDWEIWFAPEIPIDNGPWKLGGAPGLILSAKDSNHYFTFDCTELREKPSQFMIFQPENVQEISAKDFYTTLKKFKTDQTAMFEAKLGHTIPPEQRAVMKRVRIPTEMEIY